MRRPNGFVTFVAMTLVVLVTAACAKSGPSSSTPTGHSPSGGTSLSASSAPVAPLVGRWEQVHHCQDLVDALDKAGLGATAPATAGDFFPDETAQQLAQKTDLCAGAGSFRHSHFFTQSGQFGSLDQSQNQVDNGTYTLRSEERRVGK